MDRRVVAIFACSFLSVSPSLPALAEEAGGIVEQVDETGKQLTLIDGSRFELTSAVDVSALRPGMLIHVIYETQTS